MGSLVKIHHLDVLFPYTPYQCQIDYMEKVIQSLDTCSDAALESPTGTGKTLSLLCATLAWVQRAKTQLRPSFDMAVAGSGNVIPHQLVPRIFYCSRTHSQLSQVVRELNKTMYKNVKVCTMGSRDQLCIHEQVSKEKDNQTKALKCRNLVKKRACHYYNGWNGMDISALDALYSEGKNVLDIEDLARTAKEHKHCPFFRSRQQQETAELILLPYNYLIDPHLRQTHKIDLKGNIIIFDEAHNLEGVCEESVSTVLSSSEVAYLIKELQYGLKTLEERNESIRNEMDASNEAFGSGMNRENKEKEINMKALMDLIEKVFDLENKMDELYEKGIVTETIPNESGKVFAGRSMIEMLEKVGFRRENAVHYSELLHQVATFISEERAEEGSLGIKDRGKKLLDFGGFLCKVFADSFESISRRGITDKDVAGENFKIYAVKDGSKITLNYWCLTAGIAMRFLKSRGVLSIIVTSGTLAPLEQFTKNLGIPFNYTLQNKHAAKPDQVSVIMVSRSSDGSSLNGSYTNRDSLSYVNGVGEGIVKVVENVPHGVLVFFSSYKNMDNCVGKWKERGACALSIWQRISRRKDIVVEPRNKMELVQARFTFDNSIKTKGGAVFFAVARGKVSEGIDFADTHSRAVCIVGIPYPPVYDVRVVLKRNYLTQKHQKDKQCMSGEHWYSTEGYRAVNQAIGRVLRHVNDYGVVVLLDSRFGSSPPSSFPRWVQNSFERIGEVKDLTEVIKKFFMKRGDKIKGIEGERGLVSIHSSNIIEKKKKTTIIDSIPKSTVQPMGIRDIASEYTSKPIEIDEEITVVKNVTKGTLSAMMSTPSSSSSSISSRIPMKRSLPLSLNPLLQPSLHSTQPSQSKKPKLKLKANERIGEEKKINDKEKNIEDIHELKRKLVEAGAKDELFKWLKEYRENRDDKVLVMKMVARFLPHHIHIFKGCKILVQETTRSMMDDELKKRKL